MVRVAVIFHVQAMVETDQHFQLVGFPVWKGCVCACLDTKNISGRASLVAEGKLFPLERKWGYRTAQLEKEGGSRIAQL